MLVIRVGGQLSRVPAGECGSREMRQPRFCAARFLLIRWPPLLHLARLGFGGFVRCDLRPSTTCVRILSFKALPTTATYMAETLQDVDRGSINPAASIAQLLG